jgi:predicted DNA-binding protein
MGRNTKIMSVKVTPAQAEKLRALSTLTGQDRSKIIRSLIDRVQVEYSIEKQSNDTVSYQAGSVAAL